jgi:hypothetical protein
MEKDLDSSFITCNEEASSLRQSLADNQLTSSMKANSSDFIGDIIDESGDVDNHNPSSTIDDVMPDAEEKKEAEIKISSRVVPQTPQDNKEEVGEGSSNSNHFKAINGSSNNSPLPASSSTASTGGLITFKFSYEPRDYERKYYEQLFYHVVSTSNISSANNKPKEEIIVSPKEAAKLFYKSGVPPERLRMIWNMATLPSNPLPPGTKPPPSMTYGQFQVAVRLIQLFQNRVAALDDQLNVSDGARTVYSSGTGDGKGGGGDADGGYVMHQSDKLAPAYFNGISGELVPLPSTMEDVKIRNGMDVEPKLVSAKIPVAAPGNEMKQVRRRSSRNSLSSLSTNEDKSPSTRNQRVNGWYDSSPNNIPRSNMPAPHNNGESNLRPMPLAEMEREIRRLSATVSTLQREVEELKLGNNAYHQRNNISDDDPSVGVEIYWGEKRREGVSSSHQSTIQSRGPASKARASPNSISPKGSIPAPPIYTETNNGMANSRRNRLRQSQNIPSMHPSSRGKGNIQLSQQPMKIPEEGSLTAQMQAVRREEEFDTLLNHARDRIEGDGGSNAGSRQSNRSGSFRPARLNQSMVMPRRNPNRSRPTELAASARHIIRDNTGKVEVYSREEVEMPSTKAVDLAPLNPPPLQSSNEELLRASTNQSAHRKSTNRRRW